MNGEGWLPTYNGSGWWTNGRVFVRVEGGWIVEAQRVNDLWLHAQWWAAA